MKIIYEGIAIVIAIIAIVTIIELCIDKYIDKITNNSKEREKAVQGGYIVNAECVHCEKVMSSDKEVYKVWFEYTVKGRKYTYETTSPFELPPGASKTLFYWDNPQEVYEDYSRRDRFLVYDLPIVGEFAFVVILFFIIQIVVRIVRLFK